MPDPARKSKMISLRLSAQEFAALHTLYPNYGARSISDFARLAMQRVIGHPLASDAPVASIDELDQRFGIVEETIGLLLDREREME
jgi:hypothetical protein